MASSAAMPLRAKRARSAGKRPRPSVDFSLGRIADRAVYEYLGVVFSVVTAHIPVSSVNYTSVYAFSSRKSILKAAGGASVQNVYDKRCKGVLRVTLYGTERREGERTPKLARTGKETTNTCVDS